MVSITKTRKKRTNTVRWLEFKKKSTPYLFIAPNLIGFLIFILIPVLFSAIISFTDFNIYKGVSATSFVGMSNYKEMFTDEVFHSALINNTVYAIGTIPVVMAISVILATILNDKVYGKSTLRAMIFIPYISSIVAVASVWIILFNPSHGIINQVLRSMGVVNVPGWMGSATWALPGLMIIAIWMGIGYNTVVYMGALQSIDASLYEAAQIDGAGSIRTFFSITLPSLKSTTFFLAITNIIASFQVFGTVNLMTDGGPAGSTTVLAYYIYIAGFRFHRMGYSAAMAWLLLLIIFLITLTQWRLQKRYEDSI